MNIFVTSSDPQACAEALDDRRVVKMTTETAQILSDALRHHNGISFYKKLNPNHPCVIWAASNMANFTWTMQLLIYLNAEYRYRYDKMNHHKAYSTAIDACLEQLEIFPTGMMTRFNNSSMFKDEKDVIIAYQKTLNHKWMNFKRKPCWTKREAPIWREEQ